MDGVLQRSEQHLRVSFSLIRSPSNVVEWSGTFDGAFPQLFDLQSRVADGVANALRVSITPAERARIEARPTASPSAWEEYTAALALLDRQDKAGNAAAAVVHLESALRADPRFAKGPRRPRARLPRALRGDGRIRAGPTAAATKRRRPCGSTRAILTSAGLSPSSCRAGAARPRPSTS